MYVNSGIYGMHILNQIKLQPLVTYRHFERFRSLKLHVEEHQENCEKCQPSDILCVVAAFGVQTLQ